MATSPTSSSLTWRSSPSQSSQYRGVQRGGFDSRLQEEKPHLLEATTFVPPSPPVTLGEETRKIPVFNYKPTALQWWFMAVLVAVLITLTALTEHSLRSLPGYGLDHDLEKRTRSITERQFPRFVPQVRNITAVRTSFLPPDSNTAAISAQAPVGATSEATAELPALGTSSIASYESTATSRTATKQEDSSKPTRVPTASSKSSIQSIKSSPTQNTHGQTSQAQILESETSQSRTVVGPTSTAQVSESHPLPAGNGAHQTHNEVLTSAKSPTTSTSICFGCSVVFSTAASAYLSLGTVTSTVHVEPTLAASEIPSTIILQQATTLPDSTTVIQHVATNPAGSTVSEAVTSTVPGASGTLQLTVVLHPGQSWVTTTGPVVVSTVSSQTAMYTTALTNGAGERITSIYLTTLSPTPLIVTTTYGTVVGSANRPDPTSSPSSSSDTTANSVVIVIGISRSQYLIGSFLPTILAVLVAMPLKAIDNNARLFQPFIALATSKTGTTAEASIFLRLYGWRSVLGAFPRTCRLRQPVVIVGRLLVAGAALLAPLAAEAVKVHVPDDCTGACPGSLGLDRTSGRALQVLLVLLIALLVAMVALLAWLKTGVRQNPWSIAGMAALGVNKELRDLLKGLDRGLERLIHNSEISGALDRRRYALNGDGVASRYGIRVTDFPVMLSEDLLKKNKKEADKQRTVAGRAPSIPLYLLTLQGRIVLLLFISAVLVLLLYYENSWGDTGLERFMDGQGFGVRFFFTALGVALGFSMIRFFRCVAVVSPYLLMSKRALPAQRSILISPPTNPCSGLYSALRQRHLHMGILAVASLLAEFLPITLSHVPFSILETSETQHTCAYLSIAILVVMLLAVAGSLAVRWPHMPVDPRTIAGAMYYLCDSSILDSFDGLAGVEMRDRDWMVKSMCVQYRFGPMVGISGKERVGIDAVDASEGD